MQKLHILFFLSLISFPVFSQNVPVDLVACDFDGTEIAQFDLQVNDFQVLGGQNPADFTITYHETQQDASNGTNPLISPYSNVQNPQVVFVRFEENSTGNFEITTFNLIVNPSPLFTAGEVIVCDDGGNDGITTFDLTESDFNFTNGNPNYAISYHEIYDDAILDVNAIVGPYTNTIPYQQEIYVRIVDIITGCSTSDTGLPSILYLNIEPTPIPGTTTPLVACDDDQDGFAIFNLNEKFAEIIGTNNAISYNVSYYETQADADAGFNALASPYNNIVPFTQIIYARLMDNIWDCYETTSFDLIVDTNCFVVSSATMSVCSDDPNFLGEFDLNAQNDTILNVLNPSDYSLSFFETLNDAENNSNPISNTDNYTQQNNQQIIYVRVENISTLEVEIATLTLYSYLNPIIAFDDPYFICSGEPVVLYPNTNGQNYSYLWSTGETTPEIIVNFEGDYTLNVIDNATGCTATATAIVVEDSTPVISSPNDLLNCNGNPVFDLTAVIPEILIGIDPNTVELNFYNSYNDASIGVNAIPNPEVYTSVQSPETIYVGVSIPNQICIAIVEFNLISDNCPTAIDCGDVPFNVNYCYGNNAIDTQFNFVSSDGNPLIVIFNGGGVEVGFDELVVVDSDGTEIYRGEGNNGNVNGLIFSSTGDSLTVFIDSDASVSCGTGSGCCTELLDFDVACLDTTTIPNCDAELTSPLNLADNVNEHSNLFWNPATIFVTGYKLSVGLTSGGTEIVDNEDVGDVLNYELETLDFETTYYVTITAYNDNGDAAECGEESYTTRADPNVIVNCELAQTESVNYCYADNDTTEFNFSSSNDSPLTVIFNSGQVEVNYDALIVLDSDGANLNIDNPYGNNGDVTGLSFTSIGNSLTIYVASDGSINCNNQNYVPIDFDVFCTDSIGLIEVNAFIDENTNSIFDSNEFNYANGYFVYEVNNDGILNTVTSSTGNFSIISTDENDTYDINYYLYDEYASCYSLITSTFENISVLTGEAVTVDFPVVEEQTCEDLAVYLINYSIPPRPGFNHFNYLVLENLGLSTITSGTVEFQADLLIFDNTFNVNPNYTVTNTGNGFTIDFVNLQPGDTEYIGVDLYCPVEVEIGDIVTNIAFYVTDTNDVVPANHISTLSEVVVGSLDPNDKTEAHGPRLVYNDFVVSDEYLYYTISFQNLGTADAINVRIEDAINNQLDETTFQMLHSRHDYMVTRVDNQLTWEFNNINLPAEQDDVEGSQGYVYFRIKLKPGYALGDIIPNTGAIYFDFNAPVITNRFDSEFVEDALSVDEFTFTSFELIPNPAKSIVTIKFNTAINGEVKASVYDIQGKMVMDELILNLNNRQIDVSSFENGMYFITLTSERFEATKKLIKQ